MAGNGGLGIKSYPIAANWLELIHWRSEQFGIGEASHSLHGVTGLSMWPLLGLILSVPSVVVVNQTIYIVGENF